MNYIKTLVLKYDYHIQNKDIPKFRGAIINEDDNKNDILFHSHDGNELRYAYPLIQYKSIKGNASIVAVDAGTDSLAKMIYPYNREIVVGHKRISTSICESYACSTNVDYCDKPLRYVISNWLPLNSENIKAFYAADGIVEQISLLERILTGNILSFAKGIGIHLESPIQTTIKSILRNEKVLYKEQDMESFDLKFSTNIRLPQYIGLGKGASTGHGTIRLA